MNVPERFFQAVVDAIREEVPRLEKGVLRQEKSNKGHAHALNCIFYESILRYLALRSFYADGSASGVRFRAELSYGDGPIDLVFEADGHEYALELKRWQEDGPPAGLNKDLTNLIRFIDQDRAKRHGYELLLSFVNNKDIQGDKDVHFGKCFKDVLSAQLDKCKEEIIQFGTFDVCVNLAQPKPAPRAAIA